MAIVGDYQDKEKLGSRSIEGIGRYVSKYFFRHERNYKRPQRDEITIATWRNSHKE